MEVLLHRNRDFPPGFPPGSVAKITGFREAFNEGSTDYIVSVNNDRLEAWVRPGDFELKK
jgi:hypothetical protein